MENKPVIIFDESIKYRIIDSLGFKADEEAKLVDSDGKLATSQEFETISFDEFGGVLQGSKIPIKNEDSELLKYFILGRC